MANVAGQHLEGRLLKKVEPGSTQQMLDGELMPLICPTWQMCSRIAKKHPCHQAHGYCAWGCFRYF
jgi:hypothetical protein